MAAKHRTTRRRTQVAVLTVLLLALVAAGCGGGGQEASDDTAAGTEGAAEVGGDQATLAEQEGEVVWYAGLELGLVESIVAGFEAKTGITVDAIRLGGEEVVTRVIQESDAGIALADVIYTGNEGNFIDFKERGLLAQYESSEHEHFDGQYVDEDGYYYVPYANRFWMAYNTDLVSEEEAPRSYADLADPRWKDALTISHAGFSVGAAIVPFFWSETEGLGLDHMTEVAANNPLITQSLHDGVAAVISGEREVIAIVNDAGYYTAAEGNPIAAVFPEEGVPTAGGGVAVAEDAPHPNAARELLDYIMSQEGQQIMADKFRTVFRDDVTYPEGYAPPSAEQNLFNVDPEAFSEMHEEIKARFETEFGV